MNCNAFMSSVWEHFTILSSEPSKAECKHCHECISRGGKSAKTFTTTNLGNHLARHHPTLELEKSKQSASSPLTVKPHLKQITLNTAYQRNTMWSVEQLEAGAITNRIGEMNCTDLQPFSIVEDIGFRRLMSLTATRYNLPSHRQFAKVVVPGIYEKLRDKVPQMVKPALTKDMWTSRGKDSYFGVVAHMINDNFVRKKVVLSVEPFPGGHKADAIALKFQEVFNRWHLENDKLQAVISDNAANIKKAFSNIQIDNVSCFCHNLNLVVIEGLQSQRSVVEIVATARKICGHFNHSPAAVNRLAAIQSELHLPTHSLLNDVLTRWNSTLTMLERLLEQKEALAIYAA